MQRQRTIMTRKQPKQNTIQVSTAWVEMRVAVSLSEADAVANFLMEQGANGIIEENQTPSAVHSPADRSILLTAYIRNDSSITDRITSINKYLASLSALTGTAPFELETEEVKDKDWNAQWKSFFQPIKVTKRIVVKPSWIRYYKCSDEIIIELDPGMAFGTGTHPSTRLCLQAIEELVDRFDEQNTGALLDVGTGSGILAIAASLLGIPRVLGIDIDYQAIACARKNAERNRVADKVIFRDAALHNIEGVFSIIVANILPQTLIDLKSDLLHHLAPGGYLILSGILNEKAREVIEAFTGELSHITEISEDEWSCLVGNR